MRSDILSAYSAVYGSLVEWLRHWACDSIPFPTASANTEMGDCLWVGKRQATQANSAFYT